MNRENLKAMNLFKIYTMREGEWIELIYKKLSIDDVDKRLEITLVDDTLLTGSFHEFAFSS